MTDLAIAIRDVLERRVDGRGIVGAAVSIGVAGGRAATWVPGSLGNEPGFLAYSITKTFTAVLLLLLQEDGRISLDDSLARWFPGMAESRRISLRRVLNHTSGLPDYGGLPAYRAAVRTSPSTPWTFEQFAAATFDSGLIFEPGNGWSYSNPGYMLLKRIAEDVAGSTYADLISSRIAGRLGLRRTFVPESVDALSVLAPAPSRALAPDGHVVDVRHHYHPGWVSHGVVASTPSEIVVFFDAVFGGRFLSDRSLREMTTAVPVPSAPPRWRNPVYGLGVMGDQESPLGPLWGHGGGGPGYTTSVFHAPGPQGSRTACVMCALEEDFLAEQLVFAVLDTLTARQGEGRPTSA